MFKYIKICSNISKFVKNEKATTTIFFNNQAGQQKQTFRTYSAKLVVKNYNVTD